MPAPAVGNDGGDLATRYAHGTLLPRQEDECTNDSESSRLRSYKSFQIRFKIFLTGYIRERCPRVGATRLDQGITSPFPPMQAIAWPNDATHERHYSASDEEDAQNPYRRAMSMRRFSEIFRKVQRVLWKNFSRAFGSLASVTAHASAPIRGRRSCSIGRILAARHRSAGWKPLA